LERRSVSSITRRTCFTEIGECNIRLFNIPPYKYKSKFSINAGRGIRTLAPRKGK
jgi:hypothetical protein